MGELKCIHTQGPKGSLAVETHLWRPQIIPPGRRGIELEVNACVPRMPAESIKTGIIKGSHQLGLHGLSMLIAHVKRPGFLLPGHQTIAESSPFQLQIHHGHGTPDGCFMAIEHPIFEPCIDQSQPILISVLIGQRTCLHLVAQRQLPTFEHFIASQHAIIHRHLWVTATHLHIDRLAIGRELRGRTIEPIGRI